MLKQSYTFLDQNDQQSSSTNTKNESRGVASRSTEAIASVKSVFVNILPSKFTSESTSATINNNTSTSLNSWWSNDEDICGLSRTQRLAMFVLSVVGGFAMFGLSTMYIPRILLGSPHKFAMSYSLANILLLCSSCFLVGPSRQLTHMFNGTRAVASVVYLTSMIGTMYAVWQIRIMFVVVTMIIIQMISLLWYIASYIPYGRNALSSMSSFFFRKTFGL